MIPSLRSGRSGIPLLALAVCLSVPSAARAQLSSLVSPGRLNKAHAALEGVDKCLQCHAQGQQVPAGKCLACHQPVALRMAAKRGIHRTVTTDCISCHVEHAGADAELRPFDLKGFDHGRDAGFVLDGLHAPLASKCGACHKTRSFLSLQPACASCHADPHKGSLGSSCATCHSTRVAFAAAISAFDHGKAKFPLAGAHRNVACESCHRNKQFKGIAFASCTSCHRDPHQPAMGSNCVACHTETSWRTTKVDHARTAFPLRGKHAAVACARCHVKPATAATPRFDTCAACHADPHRGAFKQDCAACHTESSFVKGRFDHSQTRFPLTEKHAGLVCAACHKSISRTAADFRGLQTACSSCHRDVHQGELGPRCEACHSARTFTVAAFTHANPRPFFAGAHAAVTCTQCHVKTMAPARTAANAALRVGFIATATTCVSCHADPHLGQLSASCENCHSVAQAKFAVTGFSHAATRFPLTGKHVAVPCEKCHAIQSGAFPSGSGTARRFAGIGTECAACHLDQHRGQLDRNCLACHSTDTFALPRYTHKNARALRDFFTGRHLVACASCHKPLMPLPGAPVGAKASADYKVTAACISCHVDVHRGALGADCATCHRPTGSAP